MRRSYHFSRFQIPLRFSIVRISRKPNAAVQSQVPRHFSKDRSSESAQRSYPRYGISEGCIRTDARSSAAARRCYSTYCVAEARSAAGPMTMWVSSLGLCARQSNSMWLRPPRDKDASSVIDGSHMLKTILPFGGIGWMFEPHCGVHYRVARLYRQSMKEGRYCRSIVSAPRGGSLATLTASIAMASTASRSASAS